MATLQPSSATLSAESRGDWPRMDSPDTAQPLTEAQEGLWYAQQLDPHNPIFNTGHVTEIRGPVDVARLAAAIQATLQEADALTLAFLDTDDGPRQYFDATRQPVLERVTLSDEAADPGRAERLMRTDLQTPIDPRRQPLARHLLIEQPGRVLWFQRVHHLAADGYGMALIEQRAMQHYQAMAADAPQAGSAQGSPLTSFAAVVADDARYRSSEQRRQDARYWQATLSPLDTVASLTERSASTGTHALHAEVDVPDDVLQALRAREQQTLVSWPDILTLLMAAWVQRHTGSQPVVPGVPYMGRLGNISARSVATVMNVVPLVLDIGQDQPLDELITGAARQLKKARRHGRYRSEQMRRDLARAGGQGRIHGPLLNILPFDAPYRQAGLDAHQTVYGTGPVEDLNLNVRAAPDASGMRLQVEANPKLYREADIAAMPGRLLAFLRHALLAQTLRPVQTLYGDERRHWVSGVNDIDHPVPDTTLVALARETCTRHGARDVLRMQDETVCYADFDTRTDHAARLLVAAGVQPRDIVAVALPRSPRMVMSLHAIQRAGAAYLPLDIEQPPARIARILAAARPRAVIVDENTEGLLADAMAMVADQNPGTEPGAAAGGGAAGTRTDSAVPGAAAGVHAGSGTDAGTDTGAASVAIREDQAPSPSAPAPVAVALDTLFGSLPADSNTTQLPVIQPTDPAYVIYTSGSTGEPKGVMVSHRAIVNRLLWMREHYGFGPDERFLQKTAYTFDVSVWELFLPMLCGGTLVVAEPDVHKDPQALAALIRRERVDVVHFVPSMLAAFLDEPGSDGLRIQAVFCSGEALPAQMRDRFHARIDSALHNLYGPTEAAVDVSHWAASRDDRSDPVPIGFPVWNTGLYILDECLRPVAPGVTGTLYLGGRQLADGYVGRPDLTEARFITHPGLDPDHPEPVRLYDTGDLARWRADGAVEYRGRIDHQVKLRGQRIELGEIEAAFETHPQVRHVAVLAPRDARGEQRLVAYVVTKDGTEAASAPVHENTDAPSLAARPAATGSGSGPAPGSVHDSRAHALPEALLDYVRSLLPPAMVPSLVMLLPALPINSSGKLDRKALPAPTFAAQGSTPPRTPAEQQVAAAFAGILGLPDTPGVEDDFFVLGGHSLLATRLAARLRQDTGTDITLGAVFEHPDVGRLAAWIERLQRQEVAAGEAGFGPLFRLRGDLPATPRERPHATLHQQTHGTPRTSDATCTAQDCGAPPALFCFPPAGGLAWCYGLLARRLSGTRPVIGLQSPALTGQHGSYPTLRALSAHYADLIQQLQPAGPYHLLGWSTGGILAQDIACQLQARGATLGVVCLLDAYPADAWRDRAPAEAHDVWRAILHIAGQDPDALTREGPLTRERVIGHLRAQQHPLGNLTDEQLHGIFEAVGFSNTLVRDHRHQTYDGTLLYIRAALDHAGENLSPDMWAPFATRLDVHDAPSLHAHLPGETALDSWLPPLEAALQAAETGVHR